MSTRGRRLAVFLPVLVTLVVAAVVGVLVVVQDQRQAEQVAAADEVGNDYLLEVAKFREAVARKVNAAGSADPGAVRKVVDAAVEDPPRLGDAPDFGKRRSETYAEAVQTQETVLAPYRRLSRELRRADVALDFIAAARGALELRATDYVGFGPISSSDAVRRELLPAFVAARDRFLAVRVPKGQDELAETVRDALQYVIDQATVLAARLEGGQNYSFSYGERFTAAIEAVEGYATTVKGDVTEAINEVTEAR